MKKYIAPNAKTILLGSENNILFNGSMYETPEDVEEVMSNHRDASQTIWGE